MITRQIGQALKERFEPSRSDPLPLLRPGAAVRSRHTGKLQVGEIIELKNEKSDALTLVPYSLMTFSFLAVSLSRSPCTVSHSRRFLFATPITYHPVIQHSPILGILIIGCCR